MQMNIELHETVERLVAYFSKYGDQSWAKDGAQAAREWLRLLQQDTPNIVEVRLLLSTLESGAAEGGSAWEEMLVLAQRWSRSLVAPPQSTPPASSTIGGEPGHDV
jgi:hypothetical protein